MQKHEEWLFERLPEWEKEGLIDSASAERLRTRYEQAAKPVASRGKLAMYIVSAIGALLVGLGVIALFAANWGAMSRGMRAGISVLPLTICTLLALAGFARGWKTQAFWEALGILWTLAIWSGFGLVCQTYHLSDDVCGFILACTLLCLPIPYLTHSAVATVVWPIYGLVWFLMTKDNSLFIMRQLGYLVMLLAHLPIFLAVHRRLKLRGVYDFFGAAGISVGISVIIFDFLYVWGDSYASITPTILCVWMGASLWLLSEQTRWRSLRLLGLLYLLPSVLVIPYSFRHFSRELYGPPAMVCFVTLVSLAWAGCAFLLLRKGEKRLPLEHRLHVILLIGLLGAVMCIAMGAPPTLLYFAILAVAVLLLVQALRHLRLLQMNLSLGVVIYEILSRYLASDWSFTAKGLVMLFCGIALLFSNIFILRGRRQASKEVAS